MPEISYVTELSDSEEILDCLSDPVRNWFKDTFDDFTGPWVRGSSAESLTHG